MNLPAKFEICTKYDRTSRYTLTLDSASGKYCLQNVTCLEDAYNEPIMCTAKFVEEAIDCGNWIVTKDMSPATEPELVYPFTVMHKLTPEAKELFVVTKGWEKGWVTCTYPNDGNVFYSDCFTEDEAKSFIKDGTWIVKQVGEAPETFVKDGSIITNKITVGSLSYIAATAAEAPQSAPKPLAQLTIAVDSSQAVEALEHVNALAQAYEHLAIAMESVMQLTKELKGQA